MHFIKKANLRKHFVTSLPGQFATRLKHTKMYALFVYKMK